MLSMDKTPLPRNFKQVCIQCGTELIVDNIDMAQDIYDEYEGDDEAYLTYLHCPKCGTSVECLTPLKEERDNEYKEYWKK